MIDKTENTEAQMQRELDAEDVNIQKGVEKVQKARASQIKHSGLHSTSAAQKLVDEVIGNVVAEIERRQAEQEAKRDNAETWVQHIAGLNLSVIAEAALITALDAAGRAATYNSTLIQAGKALHIAKYNAVLSKNRKGRKLLQDMDARAKRRCQKYADRNDYVAFIAKQNGFTDWENWSDNLYRTMGSWMLDIVHVGSNLVVFENIPEKKKPKGVKYVVLTEEAQHFLATENMRIDRFASWYGPMLTKPNRWPSVHGPYHDKRVAMQVPMVKKMWSPEQKMDIENAIDSGDFDDCLDAINTIQETPMKANPYIVEAVRWVWSSGRGKDVSDFPKLESDPIPARIEKLLWASFTKTEKADWYAMRDEKAKDKVEASASLQGLSSNVGEAEQLSEEDDVFYLPHQFDRRGRIYHTSVFGHHNTDYVRAMFLFANESEIDDDCFVYFGLQLANSWGNSIDKKSLEGRQKWVEAHLDQIIAAGKDFQATFDFWSQADDPFQFLAAARELYNYQQHGEGYKSGLPIGLDATQSGCQHYAAAMLHEEDGVKVNLNKSDWDDTPNDLYDLCKDKAQAKIDFDLVDLARRLAESPPSNKDTEEEAEQKAKWQRNLQVCEQVVAWGGLTRGMLKSPTMTWCYSSRRFGFMKTMRKKFFKQKIRDKIKNGTLRHPVTNELVTENPFRDGYSKNPHDGGFIASIYLAGVYEDAIRKTVESAAIGQEFFQKCATALANEGSHFKFVTPLGFPMHQFYQQEEDDAARPMVYLTDRVTKKRQKSAKASVTVFTDDVKMPKSQNAVAPNVIHAMDATHLMKTVLLCKEYGVYDIMVVHDSFSVPIGDVQALSYCVRQAFVDLYEGYCLYTDVLEQTKARLADPEAADLPEVPEQGTLNLQDVLLSSYAFS